ncbi:hypothetical protein [Fructobacillus cardui]|uniref:hypothetical protein n=1 Tax=Fructobacillus cardui TaxID=2893170 RepID=UPI002D909F28|nr:Predicted membrane glycosyltransferase TK1552 [Fructobacillus cardui]
MPFNRINITSESLKKIWKEIFPIISLFVISLIILNNTILNPVKLPIDNYYHLSRIKNLTGSFYQALYPQNFLSLGQVGVASNIFYPAFGMQLIINLIPHCLGIYWIYKIFIVFLCFSSSLVSYLVLRFKVQASKIVSIALSLLWSFLVFPSSNIAEALAKVGIPLICYGLIRSQDKKSYKYVVAGLTISFMSHILTSVFLAGFVVVYYVISYVLNKEKEEKFNLFRVGLYTLLTTASVTIPLVLTSLSNHIKSPTYSSWQFQTWFDSIDGLFSDKSFLIFLIMILFFLTSMVLLKNVSLGQQISFILAIFGTGAIGWQRFLQHTPLSVIQIPGRIFYYGMTVCFCFSIFLFATGKWSKNFEKILTMFVLLILVIVASVDRSNSQPDVDYSGQYNVLSKQSVNQYYLAGHDGYGLDKTGAFNQETMSSQYMWQLMNYADYAPKEAFVNKNIGFLRQDSGTKSVAEHKLMSQNGKTIDTKNYKTASNSITFQPVESVEKGKIKLPVFYYKNFLNEVLINGKKQKFTNDNGLITVNSENGLRKNDVVQIKQFIPMWEIIALSISVISIIWIFVFKK